MTDFISRSELLAMVKHAAHSLEPWGALVEEIEKRAEAESLKKALRHAEGFMEALGMEEPTHSDCLICGSFHKDSITGQRHARGLHSEGNERFVAIYEAAERQRDEAVALLRRWVRRLMYSDAGAWPTRDTDAFLAALDKEKP